MRRRRKQFPQFVGRVQMTRDSNVFVIIDGEQDDIYVKSSKARHALDGDTVRVSLTKISGKGGRAEGEITEILKKSGKPFVGIFHSAGNQAWVLMQSKSMPYDIEVDAASAKEAGAVKGMKVAAVVDHWERSEVSPVGHISDVLGMPGENDTEMHAILAEFNLPYRFESSVEKEAEAIPSSISEEEFRGRRDFRDTLTFTIDPSDAKDFDDALSFRTLEDGDYEVGVHIADVSHYVRPQSLIDKEARDRGTSVYLVDRTVPMLPEKLCNSLCSLREGEDKLTFSVVVKISPKGEIRSRWIGRTAIRSDARLDYGQAQQVIEGNSPANALEEAIVKLWGVASALKKKRFEAGAIDFDRPETKVEVDENGKPVRIVRKIAKESNNLIEEFMLLANRTVAEFIATDGRMNAVASKNAKTFVYRIHAEPNEVKLELLRNFVSSMGYGDILKKKYDSVVEEIKAILDAAAGKPEKDVFASIALRAMAKAEYSTANIGHYGLAFRFYTHFTSPIRRYPDLMVHRLLASYLSGAPSANRDRFESECRYASERELVAAEAERTSIKYKLVEFMLDKVGMEFEGSVSGLTEWGMYVETDESHVEGMIPLREMESDFYVFDEARYRIVGRRTHKVFRLGDKVTIKVVRANLEQRVLDYQLVEKDFSNSDKDK